MSKEAYENLENRIKDFLVEMDDGAARGIVLNWVLLVDYVPSNGDSDTSGFALYYKDGSVRWTSALGLSKMWQLRMEEEFKGADNGG